MGESSGPNRVLVDEEERKRLIAEIGRIKDVLDSFKYGLNFEEFADEVFKTVNRQTVVMKRMESTMLQIIERIDALEKRMGGPAGDQAYPTSDSADMVSPSTKSGIQQQSGKEEAADSKIQTGSRRDELERQASDLELKIGRLFEKENELLEMGLNDPASAAEYEEKARVAREMRIDLENQLKSIKEQLE
ncbi:hypothetical protein EU538_11125 [Candidatus Thorarchaeota archaeon]|nr:MAG: hypothetical protein EU538_11125 [Candidatus Thorarchaeota archaeon]